MQDRISTLFQSCHEKWYFIVLSFLATHLDIDECLTNPCNSGECQNDPGNFTCTCNPGWRGSTCEGEKFTLTTLQTVFTHVVNNHPNLLEKNVDIRKYFRTQRIGLIRNPSPGAYNYPVLSRRFNRPIYFFSLNLSRIKIPTGTSVTNCNHKHGLMLTCRHDVDMFT